MPDIGRKGGIVERDGHGGDIPQFDKLIPHIVSGADVWGMIHDLADDDGTDLWIRIRGAGALAKLLGAGRIVDTEGSGAQGNEILKPNAVYIPAE